MHDSLVLLVFLLHHLHSHILHVLTKVNFCEFNRWSPLGSSQMNRLRKATKKYAGVREKKHAKVITRRSTLTPRRCTSKQSELST
ncbi:unnamed protein product [Victoria cruziana]